MKPDLAIKQPADLAPRQEPGHHVLALERLRRRVLVVTTLGYIGCFAVWTIFAIIGVRIQRQYRLTDTEFGLLVGVPFLSGSLMRVALGVRADRHGGRRLFLAVMMVQGFFMALGKAAVFKHIPVYYPDQVGLWAEQWGQSAGSAASCCHWLLA